MGEQQKKKMKKKAENKVEKEEMVEKKNSEGVTNGEGGGKKSKGNEANNNNVVELKVDMHCACDGCADNIKKYIKKHLQGVEGVSVHESNTKLKVKGNVDAWKLKELIETKFRREVNFISPRNPPKKKERAAGGDDEKKPADKAGNGDNKDGQKKAEEKKAKQPIVSTVGLKIRLHCNGCIDRIKKYSGKFEGVDEVTVEESKDLVTINGTMDVKVLVETLKEKFKRHVEVIPQKKDEKKEKGGEKKQNGENNGGEKKDDGGEKMIANATIMPQMPFEMNRMEYYGGGGYFYPSGYYMVLPHAPQLFSDENPNACSIM